MRVTWDVRPISNTQIKRLRGLYHEWEGKKSTFRKNGNR